jgi:hypothetical protein
MQDCLGMDISWRAAYSSSIDILIPEKYVPCHFLPGAPQKKPR